MAGIKLVAFDVDGVLRESSKLFYECHKSAMRAAGLGGEFKRHFDVKDLWHFKGLGRFSDKRDAIRALYILAKADKLGRVHEIIYMPDAERRIERLVNANSVHVDEAIVDEMLDSYMQVASSAASAALVKLYPGTADVLRKLRSRGIGLVVFTNAGIKSVNRDLRKIMKYFDYVITPQDVKNPKPSGEGLFLISKKSKVKISEMVYVGDTVVDMRAAKDAGCRVLAVCCGMGLRQHIEREKPDYIFKDLKDASKWIMKNRQAN